MSKAKSAVQVLKAKTVKDVLIAARWMIENVGWCQNAFAKNAKGEAMYVDFISTQQRLEVIKAATCMCANGAIRLVEVEADFLVQESSKMYSRSKISSSCCS